MADSQDYTLALDALLNGLRVSGASERSLAWLADAIERELQRAEDEARATWNTSHADADAEGGIVLSAEGRFQIALHVVYHHLVSVPRMWAHVQQFWQSRRKASVILLGDAGYQVTHIPEDMALHTADTARSVVTELVRGLAEQYELTLSSGDWPLPTEEDSHGQ